MTTHSLFDTIYIGNSLESVDNPFVFLKSLKRYLTNNGKIVGECKNIGSIKNISLLLSDNWYYENFEKQNYFTSSDISRLATDSGYKVTTIYPFTCNLNDKEKEKISFSEQDFETVRLESTDAVTAFFSIPFCNPDHFNELWDKIYESINVNGYFVGQLFGDRDEWKDNELINTFTIEEAKAYLKRYKILKLDEIEYVRESDNKKWHFYNIIAKKEVS